MVAAVPGVGGFAGKRCLLVVGLPLRLGGKLYNCAAVLQGGKVLGLVPKTVLPNYGEFYEKRQFTSGADYRGPAEIPLLGQEIPFGRDLLFCCREMADFVLGVEICEDLWAPVTPSTGLCLAGATVIANLSASNELIGKGDYRKLLISSTSARLLCGYVIGFEFESYCLLAVFYLNICMLSARLSVQRPRNFVHACECDL